MIALRARRAHKVRLVHPNLYTPVLILLVQALIGCGSSANRSGAVTKFSEGVANSQQQARLAFHDANALARQESIQYVLATTRPGITEADFTPALDPKAIDDWDTAFAAMQSYASALGQLLSPDRAKAFGNAAVDLGTELKQGKIGATISPGLATAFAQFGEILISLEAQKEAQAAMIKADPGVRGTLIAMAAAIGANDRTGVRGTVWSNWQARLAEGPVRAYAQAVRNSNNKEEKRAAVESYLNMLDQRDAQLAAFASLQQSLLLLADAHTAAAHGSGLDAAGLIALITRQLDETKSLFQRFSAIESAKLAVPKPANN